MLSVYVIKEKLPNGAEKPKRSLIKVGQSKSVEDRRAQHERDEKKSFRILYSAAREDALAAEKAAHNKFYNSRRDGKSNEWLMLTADEEAELLDFLKSNKFSAPTFMSRPHGSSRREQMSMDQLFRMVEVNKSVDLAPPYQRDFKWKTKNQNLFINSVWHGFPLSELILNDIESERRPNGVGDEYFQYECADGKQRLTTIMLFMTNRIPLIDDCTNSAYYYSKPGEKIADHLMGVLAPSDKNKFDARTISVTIGSYPPEVVEIVFSRLQKGMKMTEGEQIISKRGAMFVLTRRLSDMFKPLNDKIQLKMEDKKDIEFCLKIVDFSLHDGFSPGLMDNKLERFVKIEFIPPYIEEKTIVTFRRCYDAIVGSKISTVLFACMYGLVWTDPSIDMKECRQRGEDSINSMQHIRGRKMETTVKKVIQRYRDDRKAAKANQW